MDNNSKQAVIDLARYFNRGVNDFTLKFWCGKLSFYEAPDIANGADQCMTSEWKFPTLEKFLEYVEKARNKRLERQKANQRHRPDQPHFQMNPRLNQDCWQVMQKVLKYRGKDKTKYQLSLAEELHAKHGGFADFIKELKEQIAKEEGSVSQSRSVEVFEVSFENLTIKGESYE